MRDGLASICFLMTGSVLPLSAANAREAGQSEEWNFFVFASIGILGNFFRGERALSNDFLLRMVNPFRVKNR